MNAEVSTEVVFDIKKKTISLSSLQAQCVTFFSSSFLSDTVWVHNMTPGSISLTFSFEKCTLEEWRPSELMWGKLTSGLKAKLKVQWWFCTTAPNSNCERSSAQDKTLALSPCCSDLHWKRATFYCFAHLSVGGIPLWMRDQRVFFIVFIIFLLLSINIHLLWTQRCLFQYEESSWRTFLGWGKYAPWRNCWGTMDSMDWLLLSKRVNVVCVFCMSATQQA